jgi:hypothetical protein
MCPIASRRLLSEALMQRTLLTLHTDGGLCPRALSIDYSGGQTLLK